MKQQLRLDSFYSDYSTPIQRMKTIILQGGKAYVRKYRRDGKAVWRLRIQTFSR